MKYIVVLGDGMSDEPIAALGGKTPLEYANTPVMDELASKGELGMVQNVPAGMHPGSEIANLSVLGFDPLTDFTGRSPLEALSVGVEMEPDDIIFRANLVTLTESEAYDEKTIIDHSSGEISTADADILMDAIRDAFNSDEIQFYTGTSYRDMMERSYEILNNHPLNLARAARGERKANSLWFWGAGTKPGLGSFREKTGLTGAMISAVDLLKGIAVGAGMRVYEINGATGSLHTNYEGKAQAAIQALLEDGCDFVYIHLEGPDEMAHQGLLDEKIQAIEYLDSRILAPVKAAMEAAGEPHRILVLPDHPNPVRLRTHTGEPVPYVLYDSTQQMRKIAHYGETEASATGIFVDRGCDLMERFLKK